MALNVYCGLMGHGKTYQAVKAVVVESFKKGRNIVTNIEGLNIENITEYVLKKDKNLKKEDLGTIKIIKEDVIREPNFFPSEEVDPNDSNVLKTIEGVCKSGDLIVIDEAWKYFQKSEKITKEQDTFLRKMRHYVNDKGHTSDLVLITQDFSALNQSFKNLTEMLFITKKLKALGKIGANSFTLSIYEGNKSTKSSQISHTTHQYDPEIFPLYKSYSSENAKEQNVDDRSNFFASGYYKYSMIASALLILGGAIFFYKWITGFTEKAEKEKQAQIEKEKNKNNPNSNTEIKPLNQPSTINSTVTGNTVTLEKKIVGLSLSKNSFIVSVRDSENKIKFYNNPVCFGTGIFLTCDINGEKISY